MLTWYSTGFGARIQYQNPAHAFLKFDDEHHCFAFADLSVIRPNEHDYDELKNKGILPDWAVHHGRSASLYYADPDDWFTRLRNGQCAAALLAINTQGKMSPIGGMTREIS